MKTKIIIEIESNDLMEVYPEEGQSEDDFKGEDKQKELKEFRKEFSKGLHDSVGGTIKDYFDRKHFEDNFIENMEEFGIEDYETFEDYEIKIKTEVQNGNQG